MTIAIRNLPTLDIISPLRKITVALKARLSSAFHLPEVLPGRWYL